MSLEDEVDHATTKAIAAAEANGAPRPAATPAGLAASAGSARPTGPGGPRRPRRHAVLVLSPVDLGPATGRPTGPAGPVPTAQSPTAQSATQPGRSQSAPAQPAPAADKQHSPARSAVIDPDESVEGVRIMPGSDNLDLPYSWR